MAIFFPSMVIFLFLGPFLMVHLIYFGLYLFTLLLKSYCTLFVQYCFFDWGIPATADNSWGSRDAVMDFWYSFTWSSLCPMFIALTLSNKIIIELSNVVFVQFPTLDKCRTNLGQLSTDFGPS